MPTSLRLISLLENLESQEPVLGILFIGAGLVFVMMGARIFKVLLMLSFGCVGFMLGSLLPIEPIWTVVAGAVAGVGLALASGRFAKISIAVLAGGWLAVFAGGIAESLGAEPQITLAISGFAFLAVASLTFIVYYEVIAAVMSFEGALMLLSGLIVLLSHYSTLWSRTRSILMETPALFGFLLLAGTVTGYYLQLAERQKKQVGTSG